MPECWNPKLGPIYFQAVKLHRCRGRSYLVSGKLERKHPEETQERKQNKDRPASELKFKQKKKKEKKTQKKKHTF